MKQNGKTNLKLTITIIILIAVTLYGFFLTQYTISKYVSKIDGSVEFSVAKPICELVIDEVPCISNYKSKPLYFSVNNYDKNGDISNVAMEYFITFNIPQNTMYLSYSLYLITNEEENKIELTNSNGTVRTVNSCILDAGKNQSNKYKLEIEYKDNSAVSLEDDVSVSIILNSEQVKPTKGVNQL